MKFDIILKEVLKMNRSYKSNTKSLMKCVILMEIGYGFYLGPVCSANIPIILT